MDRSAVLSLVIGFLQLVLVVVVARELGRYARTFPWLIALTAFFALRGAMRIYAAFEGSVSEALAVAVDVILIGVLVLLVVGLEQTARGLQLAEDEALYREEEYARALADYRRLARHRLANPLTAIRTGIAALRSLELDAGQRKSVLEALERESRRLEELTLDPQPVAPEERGLEPRPAVRLRSGNPERHLMPR
jgi:signal transduction histidine kinase